MTSFAVDVDDAQLHVVVEGHGDDIVLLHGFPLCNGIWSNTIGELAQNHRIIAPDIRGLGKSRASGGPFLMETLASDVFAICDHFGSERVAIVGHSLGAFIAMAFYRMFAERVVRLALVCGRLGADSPETAQARLQLAERLQRERSSAVLLEAYYPKLFAPDFPAENPAAANAVRTMIEETDPLGAAAVLRGMAQRAASDDIAPEVDVPVLVVATDSDQFVDATELSAYAALFRHAEFQTIIGSGHLPMIERAAQHDELLKRFLGLQNGFVDGL